MNRDSPEVSLVIPVFNEALVIPKLFEETKAALSKITESFEVILVDDGSTDDSVALMQQLREQDPRFKILILSRNFGHQSAYTAGLSVARGQLIAMLDGDLQDPPQLLPAMYEKLLQADLDVVYGKRLQRQEGIVKRFFTAGFHFIFRNFSNIEYDTSVGNFSMFNSKVLTAMLAMHERIRYLPGLRFYTGYRQGFVEYDRDRRYAGVAKMSYWKLTQLALDAIFSFSNFPIRICLFCGLLGVVLLPVGLVYTLMSKYVWGVAPFGWSSQVLSIYFLGSVQLVFLGILGEYIYRIYKEIQNRPLYFVREFLE